MLEGIERLRDCAKRRAITVSFDKTELLDQLDAIEREVEERYIEAPVDADGVPIRLYDHLKVDGGSGVYIVGNMTCCTDGWLVGTNRGQIGRPEEDAHHHKSPTVEDVLEDYRVKYYDLVTDMECKNITNEEYVQGIKELNETFAAKLQLREAE